MAEHGFALFATPIGRCAIVWSERGITAVRLPERRDSETRARLRKRFPHAREALPPRPVQDALERIVALLQGQAIDLSSIALDLDGVPDFDREVYRIDRKSTRLNSSHRTISYAVFCLKKKNQKKQKSRELTTERIPHVCSPH